MIKYSGVTPVGECPKNEYGNERFVVKTVVPSNMMTPMGPTILMWDRRRSLGP